MWYSSRMKTNRGVKTRRVQRRVYVSSSCKGCGVEIIQRKDQVKKSTGQCKACANKQGGKKRKTHGYNNSNSRIHVTWANMKRRCITPTKKEKRNYAGITLCDEWYDFMPFMEWALSNGYTDTLTIDRKDNTKGYSPCNCRFVDYTFQSANRRITSKNKTGFIGVWSANGKAWVSKISWMGKQQHIGVYSTKEDAAMARDLYILENELPHMMNFSKGEVEKRVTSPPIKTKMVKIKDLNK